MHPTIPAILSTPFLYLYRSAASSFFKPILLILPSTFPPFHLCSALFTFSIHFIYYCLHQNIFLRSSQNMTIPSHTIFHSRLICSFFNPNTSIRSIVFLLSINFTPHIALTIDFSALLKIATSFSLKHRVLLP